MKNFYLFVLCVSVVYGINCKSGVASNDPFVKKIWENENHCAFTSIVMFNDKFYCSFREGYSHIFDQYGNAEGKVRIIVSADGENWVSTVLIQKDSFDLRDPKLSVTPDGKLMVTMGGSIYRDKQLKGRIPLVSFSSDGNAFSDPSPVNLDDRVRTGTDWLWRVTWEGDIGYSVNYTILNDNETDISLVQTTDGINFKWVADLDVPDFPNETTVRILPDKRMLLMVRRERGDKRGYWGVSNPPYADWKWTKMEMSLGGPDFIPLEDGTIIAGTRSNYIVSFPKTILMTGNDRGVFQEVVVLPSGGDTSYPGFLIVGDELWVSYYTSHETPKAAIYLAKFPLSLFIGK